MASPITSTERFYGKVSRQIHNDTWICIKMVFATNGQCTKTATFSRQIHNDTWICIKMVFGTNGQCTKTGSKKEGVLSSHCTFSTMYNTCKM